MGAVAARAEVSVGTVYRRFENKELLLRAVKDRMLIRLGDRLTARLRDPLADLESVIDAYTVAVVAWMAESGRLLPEIFGVRLHPVPDERAEGLAALRRLVEAAAPHRGRSDTKTRTRSLRSSVVPSPPRRCTARSVSRRLRTG
jgi:AcrR family transcriptional regulator